LINEYIEAMCWDRTPADAIDQARAYWQSGHQLHAGCILYERVPRELRPVWAASVLAAACRHIPMVPEIEAVLTFARNPNEWGDGAEGKCAEAHGFFDAVRARTLQCENRNRLYKSILVLAENVAKVTYNVYGYPAPFDHDAGWRIAQNLSCVVAAVNDAEFAAEAWSILSSKEYVRLTAPVVCNLHCKCNIWDRNDG